MFQKNKDFPTDSREEIQEIQKTMGKVVRVFKKLLPKRLTQMILHIDSI